MALGEALRTALKELRLSGDARGVRAHGDGVGGPDP